MDIKDFEVKPLFATPYFRCSLKSVITQAHIDHIQNLNMVKNQSNLISEDLYIFEHPELADLKKAVDAALNYYAMEVMGIEQELYVTQSWGLVNHPGVGMHTHSHSNSLISGSLYYCELPTPSPRMVFERYTTYRQLELSPKGDRQNIYNTPMNAVEPRSYDLLLFPSELNHMVEDNNSGQLRHSVAFNTFVRGKLGNYRDVSELTL